jgi:hypothetical protein
MGLTIHYQLQTNLTAGEEVRLVVESLHQVARDLPFQEVSDVMELKGGAAGCDDRNDPDRWMKLQVRQYVKEDNRIFDVLPTHIIAFSTFPGEGCEEANFGLCKYPAFIRRLDTGRRLATKLSGWSWRSFCKTQYASDPGCGGVGNFLRCHLSVIKLLDFASKTSLVTVEVQDEGDYWQERDLKKLAENVGEWNEMIAAAAGIFKDTAHAAGMTVESTIAGFQNFEHLEAKGLERLKHLRHKMDGRQ